MSFRAPNQQPSRSFPILPNETLLHIIRLSLPTDTYKQWQERSAFLRSYALVNRNWRGIAQAELFARVQLTTHKAAVKLARSLAGRRGKGLAAFVTTLKIGRVNASEHTSKAYDWRVSDFLERMQNLKEVWLIKLNDVVLWDLFRLPELRTLVLFGGRVELPIEGRPPRRPSRLERLALLAPHLYNGAFASALVPHLRSVILDYSSREVPDIANTLCGFIHSTGPQLTSLHLDTTAAEAIRQSLSSLSSLRVYGVPFSSLRYQQFIRRALPQPPIGVYCNVDVIDGAAVRFLKPWLGGPQCVVLDLRLNGSEDIEFPVFKEAVAVAEESNGHYEMTFEFNASVSSAGALSLEWPWKFWGAVERMERKARST